jgi:hypothetical protein
MDGTKMTGAMPLAGWSCVIVCPSTVRMFKGNAVMMLLNYVVRTIVLTNPFSCSMVGSLNRPAEWPLRSKVSTKRRFAIVL